MGVAPRTAPQAGATLIEAAVAIAVVGILFAIGIPAYRDHVLRVKSVDATRELRALALRLEGCHRRSGSYARMDDGPGACVDLPYAISEGTYQISGDIAADAFLLTATPKGSQLGDAQCSAFTLDQAGKQGITGTGSVPGCWGAPPN